MTIGENRTSVPALCKPLCAKYTRKDTNYTIPTKAKSYSAIISDRGSVLRQRDYFRRKVRKNGFTKKNGAFNTCPFRNTLPWGMWKE